MRQPHNRGEVAMRRNQCTQSKFRRVLALITSLFAISSVVISHHMFLISSSTTSSRSSSSSNTDTESSRRDSFRRPSPLHQLLFLPRSRELSSEDTEGTVKRPKFVLHVGLPKTATSFLQCSLCSQGNVTVPLLLKDNWVYVGTCPHTMCGLSEPPPIHHVPLSHPTSFLTDANSRDKLINEWGPVPHDRHDSKRFRDARMPELQQDFMKTINELRMAGRNVIAISEHLSGQEDGTIRLLATFLQKDWDVRVLVAYRPLYAWLPSKYNQYTKGWIPRTAWPGKESSKAKGTMGAHVLPFDLENRGSFSDYIDLMESIQQHPTETCLRNFAMHFSDVITIPMHELPPVPVHGVDPMLNYLFCILLDTPHSCKAVQTKEIGMNAASNPSASFNYDMLASAAYEVGAIVNGELSRAEVSRVIMARQESRNRTANDFPLVCLPNRTLARLENLSLSVEQHLFRDSWTKERKQAHRKGFAKTVSKKAYCWIDTNRTLSDPDWYSFLTKLQPEQIKRRLV